MGDFLGGAATRRIHVGVTLFWSHLVGLGLLLLWAPFDPGKAQLGDLVAGVAAGLFGMAGLVFHYQGLASGRAAVVAPAAAVTGAVVPVVAGLAAGEAPGVFGWWGVALALPAIYMVSTVPGMARRAAGLRYGVIAGALFGGYFVALAQASGDSGMWPLVASRLISVSLLGVIGAGWRRHWIRPPSGRVGLAVAGVGVLDLVGNVGYFLAVGIGDLIVVAVVASLYPAVTVGMAGLLFDERLTGLQALGLLLALASVAFFSVQ